MTKREKPAWGLFVVLAIFLSVMIPGCRNSDNSISGSGPGTGKIGGVVTDHEQYLPQGQAAKTYQGASIKIYKSVEAGIYKTGEDYPEMKNYSVGDFVKEVASGKDGVWEVELPAGKYFVRSFLGEKTYSGDIGIEVIKDKVVKVDIKLIPGI